MEESPEQPETTVLLIDDDPLVRRSIALYLEDYGYQVHQAADGNCGIELFDLHRPDLVLTDLMMPGMDGVAVIGAIRQRTEEVPVVVISGNGTVSYAIEAMRRGAWDYITKPIHDFTHLEQVITQSLKRAEQLKKDQQNKIDLALHSIDLAEQLARLKHHDPLTGLPQLQQLQDFFCQKVIASDFSGTVRLLLLDLVNLKLINKTLGLDFGDRIIVETAERLKPLINEQLTLCRIGGDQFVVLDTSGLELHSIITTILKSFESPFELAGGSYPVKAALGITSFPEDGESVPRLLQNAAIALDSAKKSGRDRYCLYRSEQVKQAGHKADLDAHLHHALARSEFSLVYQPKLHATDRRLSGMEALLRWNRTNGHQPVGPDLFVPILEESGLINRVGSWVLREACGQYAAWLQQGMPPVRLSVNISAVQLLQPDFVDTVTGILGDTGVAPGCLCLELTEGTLLEADQQIDETLRQLDQVGILLSIDDFGTGYATLSYLMRLPMHEIKIDRMFVRNLPNDKHAVAITEAVLSLSRSLGITVVAEGVEQPEQADYLSSQGCHELQGYLLGRPLPPEEFTKIWLHTTPDPCCQ